MDSDESRSSSLDYSEIDDMMIVAKESLDLSKKRKLRADESDLFIPLPKHFCLDSSSCPSSDIESAECSYTKPTDESSSMSYSTGNSSSGSTISSNIDQFCSKVMDKTQEDGHDLEDLTLLEFICPEFDSVDEVLNPVGSSSYVLSSARWSVSNQVSEEVIAKPSIDQEFEDYFSTLMM